jgi:hypothetical protein
VRRGAVGDHSAEPLVRGGRLDQDIGAGGEPEAAEAIGIDLGPTAQETEGAATSWVHPQPYPFGLPSHSPLPRAS